MNKLTKEECKKRLHEIETMGDDKDTCGDNKDLFNYKYISAIEAFIHKRVPPHHVMLTGFEILEIMTKISDYHRIKEEKEELKKRLNTITRINKKAKQ